jgi:hypothetical protein
MRGFARVLLFFRSLSFLAFLLVSCITASKSKMSENAMLVQINKTSDGVYRHSVDINVKGETAKHFNGIMQVKNGAVLLVALGPFDSSMFRLEDDSHGSIKIDIFVDELKPYSDRVLSIYQQMKPILIDGFRGTSLKILDQNCTVIVKKERQAGMPEILYLKGPSLDLRLEVKSIESPAS